MSASNHLAHCSWKQTDTSMLFKLAFAIVSIQTHCTTINLRVIRTQKRIGSYDKVAQGRKYSERSPLEDVGT